MKSFLEMRGADGGPWSRICALPAFWVGLLYDDAALDAAWDVVKDWTMDERETLRSDVPRLGLDAPIGASSGNNATLRDIAGRVLDIARAGLTARARLNGVGDNETGYLGALDEVVSSGRTHAERMLERYHTAWNGDVSRVYAEESF
jgi:glutamate--cysteine ligase